MYSVAQLFSSIVYFILHYRVHTHSYIHIHTFQLLLIRLISIFSLKYCFTFTFIWMKDAISKYCLSLSSVLLSIEIDECDRKVARQR